MEDGGQCEIPCPGADPPRTLTFTVNHAPEVVIGLCDLLRADLGGIRIALLDAGCDGRTDGLGRDAVLLPPGEGALRWLDQPEGRAVRRRYHQLGDRLVELRQDGERRIAAVPYPNEPARLSLVPPCFEGRVAIWRLHLMHEDGLQEAWVTDRNPGPLVPGVWTVVEEELVAMPEGDSGNLVEARWFQRHVDPASPPRLLLAPGPRTLARARPDQPEIVEMAVITPDQVEVLACLRAADGTRWNDVDSGPPLSFSIQPGASGAVGPVAGCDLLGWPFTPWTCATLPAPAELLADPGARVEALSEGEGSATSASLAGIAAARPSALLRAAAVAGQERQTGDGAPLEAWLQAASTAPEDPRVLLDAVLAHLERPRDLDDLARAVEPARRAVELLGPRSHWGPDLLADALVAAHRHQEALVWHRAAALRCSGEDLNRSRRAWALRSFLGATAVAQEGGEGR